MAQVLDVGDDAPHLCSKSMLKMEMDDLLLRVCWLVTCILVIADLLCLRELRMCRALGFFIRDTSS